jgi:hypothetical protein
MPISAAAASASAAPKGAVVPIGYQKVTDTSTTSIAFTNIPQTYQDLMLVATCGTISGVGSVNIQLNGNTGASWSVTAFWGNTSGLLSGRATSRTVATTGGHQAGILPLTNSMSTTINHILNYRSTDMFKTILSRFSHDLGVSTGGETSISANLWPFTPAVTQLNVSTGAAWSVGSTFALYGVRSSNQ